jgi:hypothetical protein
VAPLKTDVGRLQQDATKRVEARKPIADEPKPLEVPPLDLADRVKRLEQGLNSLTQTVEAHSRDLTHAIQDMQQLQRDMTNLKQEVDRERARISRYPAPESQATGKVQLDNEWTTPMTVIVDGLSYRLEPGQRQTISKPAGNFTYEVLGVQSAVTRTVRPNETLTIRIYQHY